MIRKTLPTLLLLTSLAICAEPAPEGISSQSFQKSVAARAIPEPFRLPPFVASLTPESNIIRLGMSVIANIRPDLAKELKPAQPVILGDYQELEKDTDFGKLPIMLPGTPESLKLKDRWHYYMYVPQGIRKGQKLPLVVFLHGFGGNFKVFPWWWKDVCEKNQWVMIFPTFGMGFWHNAGEKELVSGAIKDAVSKTGIQPSSLFLMGLSNGAIGVAALANKGLKCDGLIFISGGGHLTPSGLKQMKRFLFIVGDKDAAMNVARKCKKALTKSGANTSFKEYEGQGHFLLAAKRELVQQDIVKWIKAVPGR